MDNNVLKELLEIKAKVDALIMMLQTPNSSITAVIEEVRKIAVLEEIYRLGGSASPEQISSIAKKYGKSPSSTAGYYSGNTPSLESYSQPNQKELRRLTPHGNSIVLKYREKWGINWIERIPLEIVGNNNTKTVEIAF